MKRAFAWALLPVLMGCTKSGDPPVSDSPGARLEAAALAAGLIADPAGSIAGSWARGTDRMCVMGSGTTETRIGALVDYGDGQSCAASGTLRRDGSRLDMTFGDCKIRASFDGERIALPAEVPAACDAVCGGRASLAAMAVDRVSASLAEAATLHDDHRRALCPA